MQQAGDVLEFLAFQHRRNLLVLPVEGVTWSDWGTVPGCGARYGS